MSFCSVRLHLLFSSFICFLYSSHPRIYLLCPFFHPPLFYSLHPLTVLTFCPAFSSLTLFSSPSFTLFPPYFLTSFYPSYLILLQCFLHPILHFVHISHCPSSLIEISSSFLLFHPSSQFFYVLLYFSHSGVFLFIEVNNKKTEGS